MKQWWCYRSVHQRIINFELVFYNTLSIFVPMRHSVNGGRVHWIFAYQNIHTSFNNETLHKTCLQNAYIYVIFVAHDHNDHRHVDCVISFSQQIVEKLNLLFNLPRNRIGMATPGTNTVSRTSSSLPRLYSVSMCLTLKPWRVARQRVC